MCEVECLTVNTHVAFKPHPTTSSQMQLERRLLESRMQNKYSEVPNKRASRLLFFTKSRLLSIA